MATSVRGGIWPGCPERLDQGKGRIVTVAFNAPTAARDGPETIVQDSHP